MSFTRVFRPPLIPRQLTQYSKPIAAIPQPRPINHPSYVPSRTFRTPSPKPRQNPTYKSYIQTSRHQRAFHSSPSNYRRYPRFQRIEPHNARPLITPEQLRAFSSSVRFRGFLILTVGGLAVFYITHIETVPVSGRRRFNCFSAESAEEQGDLAYAQILNEEMRMGRVLPRWDPRVRRVEKVLGRLIEGGGLGTGQSDSRPGVGWDVHVIDDPGQANAFVLPGGKVFVYSGILPICRDNDGLAAVLGHEIAHNIAQHAAEKMSQMVLLQPIVWTLMYLDATGVTLGLGRYLGSLMLELGVMRRSSREQESEADHIGLMLMAEACYDPRGAIGLWERMEKSQKGAPPEWLSTHPSNANRIQRISELLPEAEDKYQNSNCAPLGGYKIAFQNAIDQPLIFRL